MNESKDAEGFLRLISWWAGAALFGFAGLVGVFGLERNWVRDDFTKWTFRGLVGVLFVTALVGVSRRAFRNVLGPRGQDVLAVLLLCGFILAAIGLTILCTLRNSR